MCAVYVDNMYLRALGRYGRMRMSHMIADTEDELFKMADRIGVSHRWYQGDHFDICKAKAMLAIKYGAKLVTMRELAAINFCKRTKRMYKSPADALAQMRQWLRMRADYGTKAIEEEANPPTALQGRKRKVRLQSRNRQTRIRE